MLLAILPNLFFLGPLTLLAALWPALFGGVLLFTRRYAVLCSLVTALLLFPGTHAWIYLFATSAAVPYMIPTLRKEIGPRSRTETAMLAAALLTCTGIATIRVAVPYAAVLWPAAAVLAVGLLFSAGNAWRYARQGVIVAPPESVMCMALAVVLAVDFVRPGSRPDPSGVLELVWSHESDQEGSFDACPLVHGKYVFACGIHGNAFHGHGACYCLDRDTGAMLWRYDADGTMQEGFSSPRIADGRLYFGEGLHHSKDCRLHCVDAQTGKQLWTHAGMSHIESTPVIADGMVFVGAGDDGLIALDALTGERKWGCAEEHIDANPVVCDGRVYIGGSESFRCLEADSGKLIWTMAFDLPAHGSPRVAGGRVFVGLCSGDLTSADDPPRGALACLDAATGRKLWLERVGGSVFGQPAVVGDCVLFGSRDGCLYCARADNGRMSWKLDLGADVVSAPVVVGDCVYSTTARGMLAKIDWAKGEMVWSREMEPKPSGRINMLATPWIERSATETRIWIGLGMMQGIRWKARLHCLREVAR